MYTCCVTFRILDTTIKITFRGTHEKKQNMSQLEMLLFGGGDKNVGDADYCTDSALSHLTFVLAGVPCRHVLYLEYLNIWNIWRTLSGILIWFLHLILQSVFQPTFRVQRLSFAFLRETKRSSEMNVSSSTWSQRQQRQRWKRWQEILYENIRPMPLTVIMWLSLPRTQDTDLNKKEKLSFCCF